MNFDLSIIGFELDGISIDELHISDDPPPVQIEATMTCPACGHQWQK